MGLSVRVSCLRLACLPRHARPTSPLISHSLPSVPADCMDFIRMSFCLFLCLPQEELRCRKLELEVGGLTAKVAAADDHRRNLEAMLEGAKRERDEAAAVRFAFVLVLDDRGRRTGWRANKGNGGWGGESFFFCVSASYFCIWFACAILRAH